MPGDTVVFLLSYCVVFLMVLCKDFSCEAVLTSSSISIGPPQAVNASAVISTTVANGASFTDVPITFGTTLFATVVIRPPPSPINIVNGSDDTYDARVSVGTRVVTANSEVIVTITFDKLREEDDGLQISIQETTDSDSRTHVLDVKYCNLAEFEPTAIANDLSPCGFDCSKNFDCASCNEVNFASVCQATAVWNPTNGPSSCPPECPVSAFVDRALPVNAALVTAKCGPVNFRCLGSLVCKEKIFSRTCEKTGRWDNTTDDCYKTCDGLKDGEKAAIGLSSIWSGLCIVFTVLAFTRSADDECSINWLTTKIINRLGCCKYWTRYWALGWTTSLVVVVMFGIVVIVTSSGGECCSLDAQAIVGISFAVVGNAVVGFFVVALFCVKKKTSKISPRPANSNSEQPEEAVELNATSGSQP